MQKLIIILQIVIFSEILQSHPLWVTLYIIFQSLFRWNTTLIFKPFFIYLNIMWVLLMFYFIKLNTFTSSCWNYIGFIHAGTHGYQRVTLTRKNRFFFQNSKFFIPRATPGTLVRTLSRRKAGPPKNFFKGL